MNKKNQVQMSESVLVGMLLAFSGGYMDAYTYMLRDNVFSNAQTGNIILFGVHLFEGNVAMSFRYLLPVILFAGGIFVAQITKLYFKNKPQFHWRQLTVFVEILIMLAVAFMPLSLNLLASSLVSFACGIQVQSFLKISGYSVATTMCIGNLRVATASISEYFYRREPQLLKKSLFYYATILVFMMGAVGGKIGVGLLGRWATFVNCILLFFVFMMMFGTERKVDTNKKGRSALF